MLTDNNQIDKDALWRIPGEEEQYNTSEMLSQIREYVKNPDYTYEVGIGTDSQMIGHVFQFISVVCVYRHGKGGLYYYNKTLQPRANFPVENQKMRMFDEVARSIQLALEMNDKTNILPMIHIDASPANKREEFTANFSEQLKGYVQSCGFECILKPESYVAHAIADRHTKVAGRKARRKKYKKEKGTKNISDKRASRRKQNGR